MSINNSKVVVVGQGYVGLPLAMGAVEAGYMVLGVDSDKNRIESLSDGVSFVEDIDSSTLRNALTSKRYRATTDYSEAANFDIAVVTVPTPLKEGLPDLTYIESSIASLGAHLKAGATVVLESTTYPGTTEEVVIPILENKSGLEAGVDFFVGYSPERIDPGNPKWNLKNTPKVVSGINSASLQKVSDFYNTFVEKVVPVSSPREAELTKLLENTFRHVNIALVNELAIFGHQLGVNVWESIEAASTKPFGFMKFTPGPGVGGHCLPIDPSYLSWQVKRKLGKTFRFVELANDINDHMPDYVFERVAQILNKSGKSVSGSSIALVGIAYKANSSDVRESPAIRLIELLNAAGAKVSALDPHIQQRSWPDGVAELETMNELIEICDLAILVTAHDDLDYSSLAESNIQVFDTRNVFAGGRVERL